ncbi:Subtilisin-like proteinase Mp1 [Colletotrichum sp. SAR11_59]|nr:Subtilisin-like proteinase Mp1 [Colletotrichum sp. SAR11_59]
MSAEPTHDIDAPTKMPTTFAGSDKIAADHAKAAANVEKGEIDIMTEEPEKAYYSTVSVWLMVLFSGLAIGSDGYNAAVIGNVELLLAILYPDELTDTIYQRLSNAFLIGMIVGMLLFGVVVDQLGRKTGAVATTVLLVLGITLSTAASGTDPTGMFWMLIVARGIAGVGAGGEYPVSGAGAAEATDEDAKYRKRRGFMFAMLADLSSSLGYIWGALVPLLLLLCVGQQVSKYDIVWRTSFALGMAPPLLIFWFRMRMAVSTAYRKSAMHKYIISLKANIPETAVENHLRWVHEVHKKRNLSRRDLVGVEKTFDIGSFHAYTGSFDEETLTEIQANEVVERVEPDTSIYPFNVVSQQQATWGLGTISHVAPIDANASLRDGFEYRHDENGGEGTFAYVIDTGVWIDNPDFEGRAELGYTVFADIPFEDSTGHGTHVAGTIASKTWGVAKKARVIAIKVIAPGRGVMSDFMDGFSWAVNNITSIPGRAAVSVINMSLGGPINYAFDSLVHAASEHGILSVVSAGNAGVDVNRVSPAGVVSAITVAASAANNTVLSYSNFGSKVDLYAPGVDVYSLSLEAGKDVALTGTSMASPHVSGLVLYLKSLEAGLDSVEAVTARILELAKPDVIDGVPEYTPNLLAYNGVEARL